ncbi:hypothetical protein VPH35_102402 [Triticum aestivum]
MEFDLPQPPSKVLDDDELLAAETLLRVGFPTMLVCADIMEGETSPATAAAVSKVLDDDNLLAEILIRVGLPTTLVRAAAVCRRWLHHASDSKFLRSLRELHPPRLLGLHVIEQGRFARPTAECFVPMLPLPPELDVVVRRVSSSLGSYRRDNVRSTRVIGCRNGSLLIEHRMIEGSSTLGVHRLLFPEKDMTFVPARPRPKFHSSVHAYQGEILTKEGEGGLSYLYMLVPYTREREDEVQVYMLKDGVWCMHRNLPSDGKLDLSRPDEGPVLVDNKIYIAVDRSEITVLDLTSLSFSEIQLPQGVDRGGVGERSTSLARADAAGVYLIHVNELQIGLWLDKEGDWLLVDTICLREMLASLSMLGSNASLQIKSVGDNAEFVFLEMGRCTLHLDVKCRTLRKAYEVTEEGAYLGDIYPVMMIWPPAFPALKDDPARYGCTLVENGALKPVCKGL